MSSRRGQPRQLMQQHNNYDGGDNYDNQYQSTTEPASPGGRFDHITAARKAFGAKVDLSGLGPGNERVVAAEKLLIAAAGGPSVVLDVNRAMVPLPEQQLLAGGSSSSPTHSSSSSASPVRTSVSALDRAAWDMVCELRHVWLQAWDASDDIRKAETAQRHRVAALARAGRVRAERMQKVRDAAWRMIEKVEIDVRVELMREEMLVHDGLMSFFSTRRNEMEIEENLARSS